jgi:hypothetical protein
MCALIELMRVSIDLIDKSIDACINLIKARINSADELMSAIIQN